ncbi:MAG: hypothetical protein CL494_06850 [Actinobacteria bacterium]|nr:hypothetical protein [Actinomycetota bacterium]
MPYALFNSDGTCIGMNLHAIEGYEETRHPVGSFLVKEDGEIREMTEDEITAAATAANNAAVAEANRHQRNALLGESDFVVTRALEAGESVPSAWSTYRTALRDLPAHSDWPNLEADDWPTKPSS